MTPTQKLIEAAEQALDALKYERDARLMRKLADDITEGIVTGHDWPNTQRELDLMSAARLLRKHAGKPLSVQEHDVIDAQDECRKLRAELEAARSLQKQDAVDAARYRWLCRSAWFVGIEGTTYNDVDTGGRANYNETTGSLDTAIDAAR